MRGPKLLAAIAVGWALAGGPDRTVAAGAVYGHVHDAADLDRIFEAIRADVGKAQSRAELTRLYRRAGYLVALTYSRPWRARLGHELTAVREHARGQFEATVREINLRAGQIGTEADCVEDPGGR